MMQLISNDTDKALLNGIAAGDEVAYSLLFERYWDVIYSAALLLTKSPEISEDITQDVFVMIWEKRCELARVDNLQAFLFVSARNKIFSRLRKLGSQDSYQEYLRLYLCESQGIGGEAQIYSRNLEQLLQRAVMKLPPQQQKAFRLSRFEGMDHTQIAALMGVSKVTIKSYIVQALATLRKVFSHYTLPFLIGIFLHP
ncbi:RNA polymerase sigma-70 factor, ECF subfamily [Chitinophaga costaii]|uniref:RNA polymerase sigma-70 factor, ECF subfamily n=1 Tax=Chitinophaga costaii TaxID=1335309 RepID=A0A1C4FYD4_9BACT|nr:RNA polymerase sigma-70 factor [Chitinophaga costaii]PUZ20920.1 RNA polymerase sigma-70 factor [Chitinophaga costaii]SCC60960.1 RNA polymerase sigma-70 factor, ECF subfamily [Chitinophaga costaii]